MDVVAVAMAGNLMKSYEVDEEHIPVVDAKDYFGGGSRYMERRKRSFEVGDRVRFRGNSQKYGGMRDGAVGTITKVLMTGRRSKFAVRWDDNNENEVGGSYLELIKVGK